jgi:hypothetical protein
MFFTFFGHFRKSGARSGNRPSCERINQASNTHLDSQVLSAIPDATTGCRDHRSPLTTTISTLQEA